MKKTDVLVIGTGPTGLMMAAEIARHGLSCRIIDRAKTPSDKSKALVIQPRTLEIFDHLGIVRDFIAEGVKLYDATLISKAKPLAHLSFKKLSSPYPFVLSVEQSKTEQILTKYLSSLHLSIEREVELIALTQDEDAIYATLKHPGKEETLRADWIIGCDGAHSFVRKNLSLPFEEKAFSDNFSLADMEIDGNRPGDEFSIFFDAEEVMATIPISGKTPYRLVFQLERWETNWVVNSRLATSYQKGRIFIAGDAAHFHSSVGGQGMNTGIQDAFNLGWKLALIHQKKANPKLLDSYHQERHEVGKNLLKATERASRAATIRNSFAISLRNYLISKLFNYAFIQKKLTRAISQIALRYSKSDFIAEAGIFHAGPKAGTRAPNALVFKKEDPIDFYTIWRKRTPFHLLLFSGLHPKNLQLLSQIATHITSRYSDLITPLLIIDASEPPAEIPSSHLFLDSSRAAHAIYGAHLTAAYLIRPDLYVGYRQTPLNQTHLEKFIGEILL
ncbi:MAG: FAD-dependent monooxygenase [Chlamydiae bacterium]|nr:FAD-dependent monooxygenase [Chlamydiota bacterium]